ncbi:hypothetical protein [Micromonospora sp. RP3T]|uniref:hypothetical protein n=1 Tax=Micromonospora sp. RP3T TaxID=2135446 RepID=UPI003D75410C
MTSDVGAAWQHGELPPWMRPHPGFDEAHAADEAALAALANERFGGMETLALEGDRKPSPPPPPVENPTEQAHRRAVLLAALDDNSYPLANLGQRAA